MKRPKPYRYKWQRWLNHTDEGQILIWVFVLMINITLAIIIFS